MIDILWVVILASAYFVAGYLVATRRFERLMQKAVEEYVSDQQVSARRLLSLSHEVINNVHYFYNVQNHSFVCQGTTLEEVAATYYSSDSKRVGVFKHSENNRIYWFVDGKVIRADELTTA